MPELMGEQPADGLDGMWDSKALAVRGSVAQKGASSPLLPCFFFLMGLWKLLLFFCQYIRLSSRSSTPNICVISHFTRADQSCLMQGRALVLSVTGDLEQLPGVQITKQRARTPVTRRLLSTTENLAVPMPESHGCSDVQERLHYTSVCAGFCPAHQQTNAPVHTYISTGKK